MMASVFDDDGGVCVISVMASTRHYCTAVHWLRWLWSPAIRPVQRDPVWQHSSDKLTPRNQSRALNLYLLT